MHAVSQAFLAAVRRKPEQAQCEDHHDEHAWLSHPALPVQRIGHFRGDNDTFWEPCPRP